MYGQVVFTSKKFQAFLSIFISLTVLELSIAVSVYVPRIHQAFPISVRNALSKLYVERLAQHISLLPECAQFDPETFYTLKANGTCRVSNIEFETTYSMNSAGLRDEEADLTAPTVIALGDSYTLGVGVEQNETFVAKLEALTGIKILNAGISSFGTEREYRLLKRLDLSKLETIIIQYSDNDFGENEAAIHPDGFNIRSRSEYERISAKHVRKTKYIPFKLVFYLIRGSYREFIKSGRERQTTKDETRLQREVDNFLQIIGKIRQVAPSARYILTEFNGRGRARKSFLASLSEHFKNDRSVTVVPFEDHLPEEAYFIIDGHINRTGHELVAKGLVPYILGNDPG